VSHLPPVALKTWKPRDSLASADLNANFVALLGLIEVAMHAALSPDPAGVANEVKLGRHEQRIGLLEGLVAMHARQRNERELTPLAYTAAIMEQVRDLREPVQEAQKRLLQAHARAETLHDGHHARLSRLEQQPEAATKEDHDALFKEHRSLAETLPMLLAQVNSLRHEVGVLRRLVSAPDRVANRFEFAPLATVAHLLQRLMAVERRMNGEDAV
jgi:hypothetical protein